MKHADTIQELIAIARDGAEFYDAARTEVKNPALQSLFQRMAEHKRQIIASLSVKLSTNNESVPDGGTFAGKARKVYADIRSSLSSNEEKVYVAQLEECEDKLLEHFRDALNTIDDPSIKSILQTHIPQVRACHAEMSQLKRRMAA